MYCDGIIHKYEDLTFFFTILSQQCVIYTPKCITWCTPCSSEAIEAADSVGWLTIARKWLHKKTSSIDDYLEYPKMASASQMIQNSQQPVQCAPVGDWHPQTLASDAANEWGHQPIPEAANKGALNQIPCYAQPVNECYVTPVYFCIGDTQLFCSAGSTW